MKTNQPQITLHVDMDSFYSSVETKERPELKGRPVVVGSDPKGGRGRGVVSTCSYEARKYGIHSGMPISSAYKLCPDAVYLPVNMELYKSTSCRIMKLLKGFSYRFQQVSVDEAYMELGMDITDYDKAIHIAKKIKENILYQEGLTCSVGIAPNKVIAKIASDFSKPDGLTVVRPEEVKQFLYPLPISKIPGIGKKTVPLLHEMGIEKVEQLATYDVQLLIARFGKFGLMMHSLANGIDLRGIEEKKGVKSISKEDTFDEDIDDPTIIKKVFYDLSDKVHSSLMKKKYRFRTITIRVRYENFTTYTRSKTLSCASTDLYVIRREALNLMKKFTGTGRFRLLGVGVSNLEKIDERQTLITDF
ncbi:MAG: DNA polymerase IV [Methanomethylovorans sp.]|jgi:DNA polymerase IV (DinB-like DNA polymerase)|nr:DNA polymerase IV [Methanomethylovorans sp.]